MAIISTGAFGVPGLGLKRGLSTDLVIAPYATALASLVTPAAAAENLQKLGFRCVASPEIIGLYCG